MSRFAAIGPRHLDSLAKEYGLTDEQRETVALHSHVLPFRTNAYVLAELIDWDAVPADPIFQMVFPQPGMLRPDHEGWLRRLLQRGSPAERAAGIAAIRAAMNPHPGGQRELNVPRDGESRVLGVQHKYTATVLYFPSQGQTCHAYCTYCFRWAQFVGDADLKFAAQTPDRLIEYLLRTPAVTDVLVTGGDPMVLSTARLRAHVEPMLAVPTVRTIRFGTKALAYWPYRFTTDEDADDLLRLFEEVVASGRQVALMAHFSHHRELATNAVLTAIRRIRSTGAAIYCQAPIMRHINDDADTWIRMWSEQQRLGAVPYYMFMARDTGPREYFEVTIATAVEVFGHAFRQLPGLARTVRGPVMSTTPGKLVIDGSPSGEPGNTLQARFVQARDPALVGRPFLVNHPPFAVWADELTAAPGTARDLADALSLVRNDAAAGGSGAA